MSLTSARLYPARPPRAPVPPTLLGDVIDHQRDPLEGVGVPQAILEVEGPVAGDKPAIVHLDREARRAAADLRAVVEAQAPAVALRRRAISHDGGDQLVELGRRYPLGGSLRQDDRLAQD